MAITKVPITSDPRQNGKTIRSGMRHAAHQKARLIIFAEGALSGYVKRQIATWCDIDWNAIAEETRSIADLARDLNIWVVFGSARDTGADRPTNSLIIINDSGAVAGHYDKRILSATEQCDWFTAGTHPPIVTIDGVNVAFALCIEVRFPEVFAELEADGVDLVLVGSHSADPFDERLACAQASFFNLFLAFTTPGNDEHRVLPSLGVGPDGQVLCRLSGVCDETALFRVDPDDDRWEVPLRRARPWRREIRAQLRDQQTARRNGK